MAGDTLSLELGPIRPPSESESLLLRVTRNCPWNHCSFCKTYKKHKFSKRSVAEVKADIDAVAEIVLRLEELSRKLGYGGEVSGMVAAHVETKGLDGVDSQSAMHVAHWLYFGKGSVFLQDANSLVLPADKLCEILNHLKMRLPQISRITSYARSQTLAKKSVEDLKKLRTAGLDRIHVGLESGSEHVLEIQCKGTTPEEHIKGGKNVIEAGMELSEYIMPGAGGREFSKENALETARVLNEIDPHFIRVRTFTPLPRSEIYQMIEAGEFAPNSDDESVEELRLMIEKLDVKRSYLASDHIMNLLQELEGQIPQDKERMLKTIDDYLALDADTRLRFRLARRLGMATSVENLNHPMLQDRVEEILSRLKNMPGDIEENIRKIASRHL